MRAVVCEDDAVVRSLVTQLVTAAGHEVLAETDNPMDAVDLVERFGATLVVLDLNLPVRSGADMLQVLRERGLDTAVIVFTAYAADEAQLRRAGAMAVIEKPDFGALEDVLATIDRDDLRPPAIERRREGADRALEPAVALSASGVEAPASFGAVVDQLRAGDALVVVRTAVDRATVGEDTAWAELADTDAQFAVARLLREALRVQDRLSVTPEGDLVVLLMNGGPEGPRAVLGRVAVLRRRSHLRASICAGFAVHATADDSLATLARARAAANEAAEDGLVAG